MPWLMFGGALLSAAGPVVASQTGPDAPSTGDAPAAGSDPFANPLVQALLFQSLAGLGSPAALSQPGADPFSQLRTALTGGAAGDFRRNDLNQLSNAIQSMQRQIEIGSEAGLSPDQISENVQALVGLSGNELKAMIKEFALQGLSAQEIGAAIEERVGVQGLGVGDDIASALANVPVNRRGQLNVDQAFNAVRTVLPTVRAGDTRILDRALTGAQVGSIDDLVTQQLDFQQRQQVQRDTIEPLLQPRFEQRQELETRLLDMASQFPELAPILEQLGGFQRREEPGFLSDLSAARNAEDFAVQAGQLPGLADLQQIGLPEMQLDTYGRADIEGLAGELEAEELSRIEDQFQERAQQILVAANASGVNPGGQLGELEQERAMMMREAKNQALQRAIQLTGGQAQLQGAGLEQLLGLTQGQVGTQAGNIANVANQQNVLAARPGIGAANQALAEGNLGLAQALGNLSALDLQLMLQPMFAQQQLAIQGIEGLTAALQPGVQNAVQAAGPSAQLQLGAADIAARQVPAIIQGQLGGAQIAQDQANMIGSGIAGAGNSLFTMGALSQFGAPTGQSVGGGSYSGNAELLRLLGQQ